MGNDTILPNFVYGYFEKKKFLKSHKYIVTLLFIFVLIFSFVQNSDSQLGVTLPHIGGIWQCMETFLNVTTRRSVCY